MKIYRDGAGTTLSRGAAKGLAKAIEVVGELRDGLEDLQRVPEVCTFLLQPRFVVPCVDNYEFLAVVRMPCFTDAWVGLLFERPYSAAADPILGCSPYRSM